MPLWTSASVGDGLQIIVPQSAAEPRLVRKCTVCEMEFGMDQLDTFIRHVDKCSRVNEEAIEERVELHNSDNAYMGTADWKEEFDYLRGNRR